MNNVNKKGTELIINSSWIIGGKIIQVLISFVMGVLMVRFLGPYNWGILNLAMAYSAFVLPICTLGINNVIVNEFVDHPKDEGVLLGSSIGIRCITSVFSILLLEIVIALTNPNNKDLQVISFIYSFVLFFRSFDLFDYYYQSRLLSKVSSIVGIIGYVIVSIFRVVLLINECSVQWFAFAYVLDLLVISVLFMILYKRENKAILMFNWGVVKRILGKSYHYILSVFMVVIYAQMDKIMIGGFFNEKQVGLYSTAVAVCTMWTFVLQAIIDSVRPVIIETRKTNLNKYKEYIVLLYSFVIWISVSVSIVFCFFADTVIVVLYGDAYIGAVEPLRIITWYTCFSYLGVARNIWSVCENKQKYEKYYACIGAGTNLILNLLLIPFLGISGAALASLFTQIVTNLIVPYAIKETRENVFYVFKGMNILYFQQSVRDYFYKK